MKLFKIGGHYINPQNIVEVKNKGKVKGTNINQVEIIFNFSTGNPLSPYTLEVNSTLQNILQLLEDFKQ